MFDIGKILKRSWHILWNYRILWVFGLLLALTTGGSGNPGSNNNSSRTAQSAAGGFPAVLPENTPDWARQLVQWFVQNVEPLFTHPDQHVGTWVAIVALLFLLVVALGALAALVRYPSETAVMRMVDEFERSGSKLGFRQGWRLGWNRRAFRLWLTDLLLALPALVLVLLIGLLGGIIFFSVSSTYQVTNALAVVASIGLGFLCLFLLVVVAVFLSLVRNFVARAVTLDGLEVNPALRQGWGLFRRHWKNAGLMWLVMVGIGIGVGLLGLVVFFLLIPAYLVMLLPAALVAALPAAVAYGIASVFAGGPVVWVITALVAIPFFFTILFLPLVFVTGWYKLYESNVWTLTYREIKAIDSLAAPSLPPAAPVNTPAA